MLDWRVRRRGAAIAVFVFASLLIAGTARASEVYLTAPSGWEISGSQIRIHTARVDNLGFSGVSGSLRLQIWATNTPYSGGTIIGYEIGTLDLPTLQAGFHFPNISDYVSYFQPPYGNYYTTMTLEEYVGFSQGYVIRDFRTFQGTSLLGTAPPPPPPPVQTFGLIDLAGPVSYSFTQSQITAQAADVSNYNLSGISGTLRLRLWATKKKYKGGSILGWVIFSQEIGQLGAGYHLSNLSYTQQLIRPPSRKYRVTLTLEEFGPNGYSIVDYITFPGKQKF